jgi:hypothetical protein
MVLRIAVPDIVEHKMPIETNKPASEPEEEFCKRRVNIKVVLS